MPHELPSVYRVLLSTLMKPIEALLTLVSSSVNHPDHMLPFLIYTVILFIPKKGEGCNEPK